MAFKHPNLVRETSTTTGTGSYALAGLQSGFQAFDADLNTGDTCWYFARMGTGYEGALGTFTSPSTLARTTIFESSNADAAVNWGAGTKDIYIGTPGHVLGWLNHQEAAVASAATTNLGAILNARIEITGTATITAFGSVANQLKFLRFSGALTLTHNGTTLIIPGSANITTAAGDRAIVASDASGNWTVLNYVRANGGIITGASQTVMEAATATTIPVVPATQQHHPGHPKAWVIADVNGTSDGNYNVTSVTDDSSGQATISWGTDFASSNYMAKGAAEGAAAKIITLLSKAAGSATFYSRDDAGNISDPGRYHIIACGDQ